MSSEKQLGFAKKSLLLLKKPKVVFEALRDESDYMGFIMYGGIAIIFIGMTEYARYSKIIHCLVELTGESPSEISRSIIMGEVLPITFFDVLSLMGYILLVLGIVYGVNRLIFKKSVSFSNMFATTGYLLLYMNFFIIATLLIALLIPPIYNVSLYPGTYGVLAPLLRDYASLPQVQWMLNIGYMLSRVGYAIITIAIISSLRYIAENSWEEIAVISFIVLPIYIILWGWKL